MSIELSWDDVIRNPTISIQTRWEDTDEIVKSWIAQTSKLDSCLRSRDYGDDLEAYVIAGGRSWFGLKQLLTALYVLRCVVLHSHFPKGQGQRLLSYLQHKRPVPSRALIVDNCPRH